MSPKLKKTDYIQFLVNSLSPEQWDLIARLRGQPTPQTQAKKESFLNSLFRKTITRSHAKSKGRNLQQWACQKISEFTGLPWGKDEEIASREGGQSGADVRLSMTARMMFPFTVECKSGDQWSIPHAIKQCQANLYDDTNWMLILDRPNQVKENRISPIICLDGEIFFKIITREGLCQKKS